LRVVVVNVELWTEVQGLALAHPQAGWEQWARTVPGFPFLSLVTLQIQTLLEEALAAMLGCSSLKLLHELYPRHS